MHRSPAELLPRRQLPFHPTSPTRRKCHQHFSNESGNFTSVGHHGCSFVDDFLFPRLQATPAPRQQICGYALNPTNRAQPRGNMPENQVPPGANQFVPVAAYLNGFVNLVSVIPPSASLSPNTTISKTALGKSPGIRYQNGTWGGYNWRTFEPSHDDVLKWCLEGANIGLLAERYPAVDIDVLDPVLSQILQEQTQHVLGPAPMRVGRAPKALLMYRLAGEPFGRMAIKISDEQGEHLLEVLGTGRQYVVWGTHPTGRAYAWSQALDALTPDQLTLVSRDDIERLFAHLTEYLGVMGWGVRRLGNEGARAVVEQVALKAPSLEALQEAVALIPNTDALFPDREAYIKMGYAIKASAHDYELEGMEVFVEWAARHEGSNRVEGNPDTPRSDWRRMEGPYSLGWSWIAETARAYGFNAAAYEFEAIDVPASPAEAHQSDEQGPPAHSDQGLAELVVREHGDHIRYVPLWKKFLVWDGVRYSHDGTAMAEHRVGETLSQLAAPLLRLGASGRERAAAVALADKLCSSGTRESVTKFVKTDPRLTVAPESFDAFPWLLNTPSGIVNLKSGELQPHDPAALLTKQTAVGPDFDGACPEWKRFLAEATDGDPALEAYLQRVAGYCLTGSTHEQVVFFVWGPGGNGKSVFLNTITELLADYAKHAPITMFTASQGDRHPTDLASLQGARLVAASETQAGRRWDEARMKALTGGERIAARFMRGNFFEFVPQFKLLFAGNHKPEIRDIDVAMRRRIQLVPFTVTPAKVDKLLAQRLKSEWPAILAWAIRGCLDWQDGGLKVPEPVQAMTEGYFRDQDSVGRWIEERCVREVTAVSSANELFASWQQWANTNGEFVGSSRRLAQALTSLGLVRVKSSISRYRGIRVLDCNWCGEVAPPAFVPTSSAAPTPNVAVTSPSAAGHV